MIIAVASFRNIGATSPLSNPGIINLDYSPALRLFWFPAQTTQARRDCLKLSEAWHESWNLVTTFAKCVSDLRLSSSLVSRRFFPAISAARLHLGGLKRTCCKHVVICNTQESCAAHISSMSIIIAVCCPTSKHTCRKTAGNIYICLKWKAEFVTYFARATWLIFSGRKMQTNHYLLISQSFRKVPPPQKARIGHH